MTAPLLTLRDAAVVLSTSTKTVRRLIARPVGDPRRLAAYRIGHELRFQPAEIDAYILRQALAPKQHVSRRPSRIPISRFQQIAQEVR